MKIKMMLVLLATLLVCGACSEKKEVREARSVKVKTLTIVPQTLSGGQNYSGTIEETSGTSLSFAGIGTVKSIYVSEGQFVGKGQLIGVLDATSAQSAYEGALAAKEQALDAEQRMKMLHDAGSLPEVKWIEVQTQVRQALAAEQIARKGLTDTKLYAPFSGYIAEKAVEAGTNVVAGMPVVKLVKIDQVKVKINVPEEEIAHISKGQPLKVSVAALGNRAYEAQVTEKGVSADALSRSYEVKAVVNNPRHELLPGMIAEVEVASGTSEGGDVGYMLPAEIVQIDADNKPFVWTVAGKKAQKTYIITGESIGDKIAIISGLKQGDMVICEGQQKVSNGTLVEE